MEGTKNPSRKRIPTFCPICGGHCAAIATVEEGKIIDWEPDTESGLPCTPCRVFKGRANIEIPVNPHRLKHPLKRVGPKGSGEWEQITWDQALTEIAGKLNELKAKYGPETLSVWIGEPRGMEFAFAHRFAHVFGTPNVPTPHHLCGGPRFSSGIATFGTRQHTDPHLDIKHLAQVVIIWGAQLDQTRGSSEREWLRASLLNGAKLVIIDPKNLDLVSRADIWIKPRPGSDGALAMGMIKVIIEERLYDKDFVDKWTIGFDELEKEVKTFTLEEVEKATWVPVEQIQQVARMHATMKPSCTYGAGGIWSHGARSFQQHRALSILRTITGAKNIPGWGLEITPAPMTRPGRFFLLSKFKPDIEKQIGKEYGYSTAAAYVPGEAMAKAILSRKPYPVTASIFISTNPVINAPDAREMYAALKELELSVVCEIFMTPTACIADYVLPAATSGEYEALGYWGHEGYVKYYPKLTAAPGDAWPDIKILNELAKKLGMGEYFWKDYMESVDEMLKPSGLKLEQFREARILIPKIKELKDEEIKLHTPSGKVEIYAKSANELYGEDPLPRFKYLSTAPYESSDKYPLFLTSGVDEAYKLTCYHHVDYCNSYKPEPTVQVHPDTAKAIGAVDGEWIGIETYKGKITQKLVINPTLDPRVVFGSFGWFFPKHPGNCLDWDKANINVLLDSNKTDKASGSMELRGFPCRIFKIKDFESFRAE